MPETLDKTNIYLSHFPEKIGFFSKALLKLFLTRIQVNDAQISTLKKLQEKGVIVFANKYKNNFDFLFYYTRYKQLNLPYPEIGFYYRIISWQRISRLLRVFYLNLNYFFKHLSLPDPFTNGYFKHQLINGKSGFVALIDRKGFYRRFVKAKTDPMRFLIDLQNEIDKPVYIVPQLIFYSNNPRRSEPTLVDIIFGSEEKPGRIRRLFTLLKNPKKVFMEICDPINLGDFLNRESIKSMTIEHQAFNLRRYLVRRINRHRQSIIGPVLKSRVELKENILTNDRLQKFIVDNAESTEQPIRQVQKKASEYLEEIAANYSQNWIKILAFVVKTILKIMFEDTIVDMKGLQKVKRMSQKGPLILVPCHKSHLDYLIISYIFHINNMICPHIAAGKNLSFWPLGTILRGGGAFFLRRTFKGDQLYSKVFSEYIYKILEEGFNIEVFIEGGRSRTGKLLMPKLGMLSIILDAHINRICEDVIFVPIYIGYDRVLEEKSYIHEIEGGQKEPESLKQVIKARKALKARNGKVYINFSDPVSLKDYLNENQIRVQNLSRDHLKALCDRLGLHFLNSINNISVVTPHGVMAAALLNLSRKRFAKDLLNACLDTYMAHLEVTGAMLADTLKTDRENAFDQVLENFIDRKFIEGTATNKPDELKNETALFKITESKRPSLDYYKNNCIIFFIPAAYTALSILETDSFQFTSSALHSEYRFLQRLFSNEFAFDADKTPEHFVRKTLKAFIDDGMILPHQTLPDTYNLTSAGFRKLKFFAGFLGTFLESYLVVLTFFTRYPKDSIDTKDRLKKIQSMGSRMHKSREIERIESLSKISFNNAVSYFVSDRKNSIENQKKIEFYLERIQKYLNLLQD
ncbi:MAG: 1-acyl-sn-glycerol-3-phosphate acyltransferase [Desulfobacterales bacterium]